MAGQTDQIGARLTLKDRPKFTADARRAGDDVGRFAGRVDRADRRMSGFGRSIATGFKGLGVGIGVAAAGVVALGVNAVQGLNRIERIGAQTDAALRSTGGVANVTRGSIDALANRLERLTSVEAETIAEGQNLLLTFTKVRNEVGRGNDIFDRATALGLDMSVALGTDAAGAALQLGKALNEPSRGVTALRRAGVSFTAAQVDQIKALEDSNDLLGAQRIVLAELETQFGGSAAALGNTVSGKLTRAGHEIANITEGIASGFVEGAAPAVGGFLTVLEGAADDAPALGARIGEGVSAFVDRVRVGVDDAQGYLSDLRGAVTRDGLLGGQTATAAAAIPGLDDAARDRIASFVTDAQETVVPLADLGSEAFGSLVSWWDANRQTVLDGANSVLDELRERFEERVTLAVDVAGSIADGDWGAAGTMIGEHLADAVGDIAGMGQRIADTVLGWVADVDWQEYGIRAGQAGAPFITGLTLGFLDQILPAMWRAVKEHPWLTLGAILSVGFAPSKIVGPLVTLLNKFPILRTISRALFGKVDEAGDLIATTGLRSLFNGLRRYAGELLGGLANSVRASILSVFPHLGVAARIGGFFARLGDDVFALVTRWADNVVVGARLATGRIVDGLLWPFRQLSAWIGPPLREAAATTLINARLLLDDFVRPLRDAGSTVATVGGNLVRSLWDGIRGLGGWLTEHVTGWVAGILAPITGAIADLADLNPFTRDAGAPDPGRVRGSGSRPRGAGAPDAFASGVQARAFGGPVAAGASYVVGERGPELFVPDVAGTILPDGVLGAGGRPVSAAVDDVAGQFARLETLVPDSLDRTGVGIVDQTTSAMAALNVATSAGTAAMTGTWAASSAAMTATARTGTAATVTAVADELTRGADQVSTVVGGYAGRLAAGLNPILTAVGKPAITVAVARNAGGPVPGRGPDRDSVLVHATPGEYVARRTVVDRLGVSAFDALNAGRATIQRLNGGGRVEDERERAARRDALFSGATIDGADHDGPGARFSGFGGVKPWVAAAGNYIRARFGVRDIGGVAPRANASDHPSGHALDFMTYRDKTMGDRVAGLLQSAASHFAVKYLIWQQAINRGSGWSRMADRGSITANHFDHVHASFLRQAGGGAGGFDPGGFPGQLFAPLPAVAGVGLPGVIGDVATAAMEHAYKSAEAFSATAFGAPGAGVASGDLPATVTRWRGTVQQALAMLGEPVILADSVLQLIKHESGGDPSAINLWDSNARRGTPSAGLIQTIPGTFAAHRSAALPDDVYHPLANIFAGLNYGISRYGSIGNIPGIRSLAAGGGYRPYVDGGRVLPGVPALVGERGPELWYPDRPGAVVDAATTRQAVRAGGAGGNITVNVVVHPAPGMDEERLAALVGRRVAEKLDRVVETETAWR